MSILSSKITETARTQSHTLYQQEATTSYCSSWSSVSWAVWRLPDNRRRWATSASILDHLDDDTLHRTILIANINPLINTEQVKQLFGFCGQVKSCRMVGSNQFAFVEYSSAGEANAAMGLNGQMLGDRALKVENAKSARETTPQGATNPYTAIQLQQMQQLQLAQMQSSTLAAQVAQLRALAKTNPNAPIPAMSANSASQKAAALAAAALLQKKFGQTSGPGNADHAIRKRRSPSPDRRQRDRRQDERRHESRDQRRPESRDRRRSCSREHRSERATASADRRREADRLRESRDERRHASRSRHESAHRDRSDRDRPSSDRRDRTRDGRDRSKDRRDRSERDRSQRGEDRDGGREDRHRDTAKERDHRQRSEGDRHGTDGHRSSHRTASKDGEGRKTSDVGEQVQEGSETQATANIAAANPDPGASAEQTNSAVATPSAEDVNGDHSQAGKKHNRLRRSASPRKQSPGRTSSPSSMRSPSRHKHSKRHRKEHSHKKSKRDRHAGTDRDDGRTDTVEAATETVVTAVQDGSLADAVPDDLDALRQAALQTNKSALSAEPAVQEAEQSAAADTLMADASSLPVKATTEPEHMETA
ncbi:TPA: hypothetical protein ACH3X1_009980 [Trebouxia sp. C0004]